MRRDFRHWTPDEDAKLYELWKAEASSGAIATRLGRSKKSILQRVHNLRVVGFDFPHRKNAPKAEWLIRRNMARGACPS